jgi:hypothetical protein
MSKKKQDKPLVTLTSGHDFVGRDQRADDLQFFCRTEGEGRPDYWHVHIDHGRALGRDFIRYMRHTRNEAALGAILESMPTKNMDYRQLAIAQGFIRLL